MPIRKPHSHSSSRRSGFFYSNRKAKSEPITIPSIGSIPRPRLTSPETGCTKFVQRATTNGLCMIVRHYTPAQTLRREKLCRGAFQRQIGRLFARFAARIECAVVHIAPKLVVGASTEPEESRVLQSANAGMTVQTVGPSQSGKTPVSRNILDLDTWSVPAGTASLTIISKPISSGLAVCGRFRSAGFFAAESRRG